ncbi:protein phosphatase 2C domain-containing protein [Providencia rettgeri]
MGVIEMILTASSSFSYPKEVNRGNQDSILPVKKISDGFIMAVADGVGSYVGADFASRLAISYLENAHSISNSDDVEYAFENIRNILKEQASDIGSEVMKMASTTLTFCVVKKDGILVGHVGDCRLYIKSANKLKQLTKDHTRHQMLIDEGVFTARQLKGKSGKNILTTAISVSNEIEMNCDIFFIPNEQLDFIDDNMTLYIMSDGAHALWEKNPRFSFNTMNNISKFTNSLYRRIERNGPTDDYSLVGATISF